MQKSNFLRNISIISLSIFKNLRTYVYCFILPSLISILLFIFKIYMGSTLITPPLLFAIFFAPSLFLILIVNITISEWKNSVFLRRIHSAGVNKINFLFSVWTVFLFVGMIGNLLAIISIIITSNFVSLSNTMPINVQLNFIGFKGWIIFLNSLIFANIISILIASTISGFFKSIAVTQSLTILLLFFFIIFSDIFLEPQITSGYKNMHYISHLSPFKPWVWLTMLNSCDNNYNAIIQDYAKSYKSFQMNSFIAFFVGIGYCLIFFASSIYSFKWNNKG